MINLGDRRAATADADGIVLEVRHLMTCSNDFAGRALQRIPPVKPATNILDWIVFSLSDMDWLRYFRSQSSVTRWANPSSQVSPSTSFRSSPILRVCPYCAR